MDSEQEVYYKITIRSWMPPVHRQNLLAYQHYYGELWELTSVNKVEQQFSE